MDRRRDIDRLAGVIAEIQPDVIGLQEVTTSGIAGPSPEAAP
jgi:endonuclease/exonuclease/phosphatase family metal-dependent hydrolase